MFKTYNCTRNIFQRILGLLQLVIGVFLILTITLLFYLLLLFGNDGWKKLKKIYHFVFDYFWKNMQKSIKKELPF